MWDKQFEQASWNGIAFHLLKTDEERGKRLQVSELPNSDDPHIWVLGGKAVGFKFEAVFVGQTSMSDAKAFQKKLDDEPAGTLEHPYLGELELVYDSSTISHIATKKGLVTVSLKFIKQGAVTVVPPTTSNNLSALTDKARTASTTKFVKQVEQASPSELEQIKTDINKVVAKLQTLTAKMNQPGQDVSALIKDVSSLKNSVAGLSTAPTSTANAMGNAMLSLTASINSSANNQAASPLLNNAVFANAQLYLLENDTLNEHIKFIATLTSIDTSPALQELNADTLPSDLSQTQAGLQNLQQRVAARKTEATASATYEGYELANSINDIQANLQQYQSKLNNWQRLTQTVEFFAPTPELVIAQNQECTTESLKSLNHYEHPLFITGKVSVFNG